MDVCPKCGYTEVPGDECPRCRVIVSKYQAYLRSLGQVPTARPRARSGPAESWVATPWPAIEAVGGRPAGFWIRLLAALIDGIFFMVVAFVIGIAGGILWGREVMASRLMRASMTAFNLVFGAGYYILSHWRWGQTIGKMVANIRVIATDGSPISLGTAVLRYLGYWLSSLPLLVGYLMVGLRSDKRALHDLIAKTRVVRL